MLLLDRPKHKKFYEKYSRHGYISSRLATMATPVFSNFSNGCGIYHSLLELLHKQLHRAPFQISSVSLFSFCNNKVVCTITSSKKIINLLSFVVQIHAKKTKKKTSLSINAIILCTLCSN